MSQHRGIRTQELIDILECMMHDGAINQDTPIVFPDLLRLVHVSVEDIEGVSFVIISDMHPEGYHASNCMPPMH